MQIIAPRFVPLLMQHFPLRKVRGFGGKLGKQLEDLWVRQEAPPPVSLPPENLPANITAPQPADGDKEEPKPKITVAEFMDKFRFEDLVKHLGYEAAVYVRQACSGEDGNEPVNEKKTEVKAFSAVKQFDQRSGDALVRIEQLEYWVRVLSEEIILRCEDERVESRRFPLQLLLHSTRAGGKSKPRKLRIAQTTTVDELYGATMAVLRRDLDGVFPCASISMHAKDFMALDSTNVSSISSFFVKQQPRSSSESGDAGGEDRSETLSNHPAEEQIKQFALEVQRKAESTVAAAPSKRAKISAFFSTSSAGTDDEGSTSARQSRSSDATAVASRESDGGGAEIRGLEADAAGSALVSQFQPKVVEDVFEEPEDAFAQFRATSSVATSKSNTNARPSFYCDRCLRSVAETRSEHADFHYAVDLSRAERSENRAQHISPAAATAPGGRSGSAAASKKRKTGPLDAFLKR